MSDLEGVLLSDYLLVQCISKGGMADVYRARQNGEGNVEVAVKVYRSSYAQQAAFRDYFMTEAETIGQFDHPNILPLLEFGEGDGLVYAVTPYIMSGTLDNLLHRVGGTFSALQAVPIVQQLCSALQYAHSRAVIHGNIKPSNVFVATDGRMLLSDFGIARGYDDSQQSLTRVGWGSAEYAAPEQSLGVVRQGSDIYSLGVLLFRILTGQPPFTGQTPVEVLLKHVRQQPPSARMLVPSISDAVEGVLSKALQKRADDRFASAEALSQAFVAAVAVAPVASPVAKSVRVLTPQSAVPQLFHGSNPHTPLPASRVPFIVSEPHTPVPAHLAFSSIPAMRMPENAGSSIPLFLEETPFQLSQVWHDGSSGNDENPAMGTQVDRMDLLHHPPDVRPSIDQVEAMPLPQVDRKDQHPQDMPQKVQDGLSWNARLRKALPIIVVMLLLLGLAGALLSSFFYPA